MNFFHFQDLIKGVLGKFTHKLRCFTTFPPQRLKKKLCEYDHIQKKILRPARRMTKSFMHGSILFPIDHMAAFDAAEGKKMLVSTKIVIHWRETGGLLCF